MDIVLTTPYLQELVLTHMVFSDLSLLRCVNKAIQSAVSLYVSKKVTNFHDRFQKRLKNGSGFGSGSKDEDDPYAIVSHVPKTIYESSYSALYNYYHTIIKLDLMVLPSDKPLSVLDLAASLKEIDTEIRWATYERKISWDDDKPFYRLNRGHMTKQTLYDVMCHRYLDKDSLEINEDILYLQNKLLPLV
jgi:hypothetical protein